MSMFRKPGDSSSSSSETSDDDAEKEETDPLQHDSVLTRINTLDSASSGAPASRNGIPRLEMRQSSAQDVRDLLLHSLLEERTINQVAGDMGRDPSDPDVQRIGREAYQQIARQLSDNVDGRYAGNEMQGHRAAAHAGINRLTRDNLSRLAVIPEGASQALMARPQGSTAINLPPQPVTGFDMLSGLSTPTELHLSGYPGLQVDRYMREFSELDMVGKGGYGKVFKAKHKLDGSLYAVKRIPISQAKQSRIQEHGPQELESMLEEVRSLARFEHANIVRYHNAWLEFTTVPLEMSTGTAIPVLRADRLLEGHAAFPSSSPNTNYLHSHFDSLSFDDPHSLNELSSGAGIVFEYSDPDAGTEDVKSDVDNLSLREKLQVSKRKTRRGSQASQATIATISSTKSRMSVVEDADEEDDDVEMIPRSHMPNSQDRSSDVSESMISNSDGPGHLIPNAIAGPVLTLNVQMSLCETNLAAFLSSERSSGAEAINQHCFHPCVSLELLNSIVSGVDYLHAQGVVHRDLKPANVFLSLSTARRAPYGSVDMSGCKPCGDRTCVHITPRIGDFGLVAALDDRSMAADPDTRPVGTELYRPHSSTSVSEKLDVFALGVVAFEMLQKFGTRMERIAALTDLRRGVFPNTFALGLGGVGEKVQHLIGEMVHADEKKRMGCSEVKDEIGRLVQVLKA
ncbi:eukaryotic translation initiation factor 2-alpha kinase-like protein 2 [Plenodomus tracheiphilus IPT5]|uniref:Eukaryotic translation initiation factor 2-alpha kinase-like protein 2 n=1 Tax=Plenodomus tracheiphilus IPT5 TaxID=1408161 RepID=A0A6A7BML2_9PLEO|nr:eukaryotic translation initiation factor 2-alpha kinase-like protein 2 [Plenodomus tracheiphilus IPT5]